MPTCCEPGNRKRASTYPAGTAVTMVIATTHTESCSVFNSCWTKYVLVNSSVKWFSVGGRWNQNGGTSIWWRSRSCLNAVIAIQYTGNTAITMKGASPA